MGIRLQVSALVNGIVGDLRLAFDLRQQYRKQCWRDEELEVSLEPRSCQSRKHSNKNSYLLVYITVRRAPSENLVITRSAVDRWLGVDGEETITVHLR